eukprot:TRINITY_DN4110_c0_g1_i1.p1 TRINITY_DN4110_c0_g1~~TRINITY_DN4110_c0_g1_i1.p1  ORF type:complete len:293 (+),score=31.02 TRINITY_DN4110_c0_g1_i1:23-880(+)
MSCILQVFNTPFTQITDTLPHYTSIGITHIQISPVQKHCTHLKPWYRLYQPTGYQIGNSLGDINALETLITSAHTYGIKVIVDVVLHHLTGCPLCCGSLASSVSWIGKQVVNWGSRVVRGRDWYHQSRFCVLDFGPKQSLMREEIRHAHVEFLNRLVALGCDGFRVDAAKHMEPAYLLGLFSDLDSQDLLVYSEVLDGNPDVSNEYMDFRDWIQVSHFPLTFKLIELFSMGGDLRELAQRPTIGIDNFKAIMIADCHDSILGDSYSFNDPQDSVLAVYHWNFSPE